MQQLKLFSSVVPLVHTRATFSLIHRSCFAQFRLYHLSNPLHNQKAVHKPIGERHTNTDAHQLVKEAYKCFEGNDLIKSQTLFEEGISVLEDFPNSKDKLVLAIAYNNLAEVLRFMIKSGVSPQKSSKYNTRDVQKLYKKAQNTFLDEQNSQDPLRREEVSWWLGTVYNNMGLYFMENMRNFGEAKTHFQNSFNIRQKLLDQILNEPNEKSEIDHLQLQCHIAITYNNIAQCHSNCNEEELALKQFNEALQVFERICENNSVDVQYHKLYIITLNNIGLIHFNANRYDQAVDYFSRSLSVVSGDFDSSMPPPFERPGFIDEAAEEFGITLTNLATVFFRQNRLQDAERFYRQALQVFERILSPNHKYIATTCSQLAMVLKQKHQKESIEEQIAGNVLTDASKKLTEYRKKFYDKIFKRESTEEVVDNQEQKGRDLKEADELLARTKGIMEVHSKGHSIKNRMFK